MKYAILTFYSLIFTFNLYGNYDADLCEALVTRTCFLIKNNDNAALCYSLVEDHLDRCDLIDNQAKKIICNAAKYRKPSLCAAIMAEVPIVPQLKKNITSRVYGIFGTEQSPIAMAPVNEDMKFLCQALAQKSGCEKITDYNKRQFCRGVVRNKESICETIK